MSQDGRVLDAALRTDRYEVTMIDAALESGIADRSAVFEVFTRRLPEGRRYGVVAGTARVIEAVEAFQFTPDHIDFLAQLGLSARALHWLGAYRFRGDVWGYPEGEAYFPTSPVLTVESTFAEAVVLETVILSILNHDCAVAAAASRMVTAAEGRRTIEMGSRRTDPDAAVASARAAAIAGLDATSNLAAGAWFGLATAGTAAHAFTLAHLAEPAAFRAQIAAQGIGTTLLVDTWDIASGLRNAVAAAHEFGASGPGGVRIDSGDLVAETRAARALLDELGACETRIVVSGDLDEYRMNELVEAGAPIDVFGVGTSLVTGSGAPTAGLTYKLVAIDDVNGVLQPVAKRSVGKAGIGGRKRAWRHRLPDGRLLETLELGAQLDENLPGAVQRCFLRGGVSTNVDGTEYRVDGTAYRVDGAEYRVDGTALRDRTKATGSSPLPFDAARRFAQVSIARARHREVRRVLDEIGALSLTHGETAVTPVIDTSAVSKSTETAQSTLSNSAVAADHPLIASTPNAGLRKGTEMSKPAGTKRALIVVDCQNDFCEGGSLAVVGGAATVARIADHLLRQVEADVVVVGTVDAHVDPGRHFAATPDFVDSWPPHCVVGTDGASTHPHLDPALTRIEAWFAKGAKEAAYSGFEGRSTSSDESLDEYLRRRRVGRLDIVGIATDFCVAATVRSALQLGYEVRVFTDLVAAVDPTVGDATLLELAAAGAIVGQSSVVL